MSRSSIIPAFVLASAIAAAGCSTPEPPDTAATPATDPRREQIRDRLRASLGDLYDAPIPAGSIEEIRRGSLLYDTLCRACHGLTGKGNGRSSRQLPVRPPDLSDPDTAAFFSDRAKLKIIDGGIAGTPMIGWNGVLDEKDQLAVLYFLNTLVREPQSP